MNPLPTFSMPTNGVLTDLTTRNSWQSGTAHQPVRSAYLATNSTERLSFVSLHSATNPEYVVRVAGRPALLQGMEFGVVVEVHLSRDIEDGERVCIALAQAGATVYYPPQQIDDRQ